MCKHRTIHELFHRLPESEQTVRNHDVINNLVLNQYPEERQIRAILANVPDDVLEHIVHIAVLENLENWPFEDLVIAINIIYPVFTRLPREEQTVRNWQILSCLLIDFTRHDRVRQFIENIHDDVLREIMRIANNTDNLFNDPQHMRDFARAITVANEIFNRLVRTDQTRENFIEILENHGLIDHFGQHAEIVRFLMRFHENLTIETVFHFLDEFDLDVFALPTNVENLITEDLEDFVILLEIANLRNVEVVDILRTNNVEVTEGHYNIMEFVTRFRGMTFDTIETIIGFAVPVEDRTDPRGEEHHNITEFKGVDTSLCGVSCVVSFTE